MSSVKEVNAKVQSIVKDAMPFIEWLNVQYAVEELLALTGELVFYFDSEDYDTGILEKKKDIICANYIRLEYALSCYLVEYAHTYLKRNNIKRTYVDLLRAAKDKNVSLEKREVCMKMLSELSSAYLNINNIDIDFDDSKLEEFMNYRKELNV